eukprot:g10918.t1
MAHQSNGDGGVSSPGEGGGEALVGRTVRKEFPFGIAEGRVAFSHRPDGEALISGGIDVGRGPDGGSSRRVSFSSSSSAGRSKKAVAPRENGTRKKNRGSVGSDDIGGGGVFVTPTGSGRLRTGRVEDDRGMVDKDIWRVLGDGEYHGRVAYAHILVDGGEVLYHVAYETRGMERRKSRQFDGTDDLPVASPAGSTSAARPSGGVGGTVGLLRREVSRAYMAVVTAGAAVAEASVDALAVLLRLMEAQVRQGLAVDIFPLAATCSDGQGMGRWGQEGPEALAAVESSLEASLVCLMIVTCPGLDRKLCSDELIDCCLGLFRHHLARHIAPVLDPAVATSIAKGEDTSPGNAAGNAKSAGSGKAKAKSKKAKGGGRGKGDGGDDHDGEEDDLRLEKRLREISRKLVSGGALGKAYEALGLLDSLVSRVRLEDNMLLQLCNACKTCLVLEAPSPADRRGEGTSRLQPLQHGALGVLQTVSRKYASFRPLLIEDVFGLLLKMPTGRRQLRTFRIAHYFVSRFLSRCSGKEESANFQPLLANAVDDLLATVLLPEWPASELLLHALCGALVKDLKDQRGGGRDQQYCLMAMDVLGRVAGGLADITRRERECPMVLPEAAEARKDGGPGDKEDLCSGAGRGTGDGEDGGGMMLDCDRCHRWFNGRCVGIASEEDCPAEWFCLDCTILRQVAAQKHAHAKRQSLDSASQNLSRELGVEGGSDDDDDEVVGGGGNGVGGGGGQAGDSEVTDLDVFRQLVLNRLTADDGAARSAQRAAGSAGAGSGGGGHGGEAAAHLLGQWKSDGGSTSWDALTLAHDGTLRLCRRLLVERDLCKKGLDAIMGHLLALLRDPSTSLRARAVKRLAGIVDADGSLMGREAVRVSVTSSFLDEAVSVRQAAVDLVGKYILADSVGGGGGGGAALLDTYYGALMDRLLDKGVSVRKSVVRTLRGVLLWRSPHPRHAVICRALVERAVVVREEDTIRDLIRDTFQEIWFSEDDDRTIQAAAAASASRGSAAAAASAASSRTLSSPMRMNEEGTPRGRQIRAVAVQLMEVVYGVKDNDWLVKLLRGMISGPGAGDKQKKDRSKKREASVRRCSALVQALVNVQLGLDEGISAVPAGTGSPLEDLPQQLLACVATLGVLCRASPAFLAPHLHILLPYLKGENGLTAAEESEICRQVSDMVYEALPLLKNPNLAQMTELADDLVRLAYRFGSAVVHASLRCLARLVRLVTHDAEPLLGLLQSFYSSLYRHRNDVQLPQPPPELTTKVRQNLNRGLVVSGCITRFYAFGGDGLQDEDLGRVGSGGGGGSGGFGVAEQVSQKGARLEVFEMLRLYLTRATGADVRSKALQGLGQLLIGAPRLMLLADKHGVVGAALAKGAGDEVLVQALRCYKDILSAEEDRVETGLARDDMEATGVTVAQRVQGDQDGESSVVGGVLQMHLGAVLSRLFHRNRVVRAAAISLLGVMLRQGLVNPVDVVPQLLALGGDSATFVRGEAFRLLTVEDSKNGEFIRTRLLDGLFMAYTFQQHVLCDWRPLLPSTDPAAGGTGVGCSIVGPAYTLCVRPQRPSRYACLRLLLSLFSEGKAWELSSFLASSRDKVGVVGGAARGGSRGVGGVGAATPPSAKRPRSSLSRSASLGWSKQGDGGGGGGGSGGGPGSRRRPTGPLDMRALSFVCCTLAGLPYQVQEEPLFVVDYVNRQMSLQGSQCLELLHTLLLRKGVTTPPPDGDDLDDIDLEVRAGERSGRRPSPPPTPRDGTGGAIERSATEPPGALASTLGWEVAGMELAKAEEESMAHLRKTCSAAAAFSMLLRLKVYLKSAYGLTAARCHSYKPNEGTKATERPAQTPNPPPETFHPFSSRKGAAGKSEVDPASLEAAAASAAETLATGSPQELASFYLDLRSLAQADPEDYAGWEGMEEALEGVDGGGETDTGGSGSDNNGDGSGTARKRGKKRGPGEAGFGSAGGGAGRGGGGRGTKKRRASAGDALSAGMARRGGGGGRTKAAKGKGRKAKATKRRRKSTGSAPLSDSSGQDDAADDEYDDDEDWA